eukprot:358807-Alexandrium_andersonii.AAC.1
MAEAFLCKVEGRLGGDSGDLKEVRLLSRIIRWAPSGLRYEADPRNAEQLARDLLLAASSPGVRAGSPRSVSFPGYVRDPAEEEAAGPLDAASVGSYRALAARANVLSFDRPDLGFAAKECCRR